MCEQSRDGSSFKKAFRTLKTQDARVNRWGRRIQDLRSMEVELEKSV
jgi:hypothetical protein